MHGLHSHNQRRRVGRRMAIKRHRGMMMAMGRGPWLDHDHHEGYWEPTTDEQIRWLEDYQRDLEQETADVASRIAGLRSTAGSPGE
jgi:hypothetical protein